MTDNSVAEEFDDLPEWLRDDLLPVAEEEADLGNILGRIINIEDDTDNGDVFINDLLSTFPSEGFRE